MAKRVIKLLKKEHISWRSVIVNGVGAGLVYGTLAFLANKNIDIDKAFGAGFLQFLLSFASTFIYVLFLEIVFKEEALTFAKKLLYTLILESLYSTTLILAHYLHKTPDILMTVLPSILLGGGYMIGYVIWIYKHENIKKWFSQKF
ncbi:MAG: hypothetical protein KN64_06395 [Sulfurovum sp. AS07-7]|nr:MAG: hypothetical protein KN64_06395 [Sulfurovum sp. AS07-7]